MTKTATKRRVRLACLALVLAWLYGQEGVRARPQDCDEICSSQAGCGVVCWYGETTSCGAYGLCYQPQGCGYCNDGVCNTACGESCSNCESDCGTCVDVPAPECGNSDCEAGESNTTCPQDCPAADICGDYICDPGEPSTCPQDCYIADNCQSQGGTQFCYDYYGPGYYCSSGRCVYGGNGGYCNGWWECGSAGACVDHWCVPRA
jgi:hypothetical protein